MAPAPSGTRRKPLDCFQPISFPRPCDGSPWGHLVQIILEFLPGRWPVFSAWKSTKRHYHEGFIRILFPWAGSNVVVLLMRLLSTFGKKPFIRLEMMSGQQAVQSLAYQVFTIFSFSALCVWLSRIPVEIHNGYFTKKPEDFIWTITNHHRFSICMWLQMPCQSILSCPLYPLTAKHTL